MIYGFKESKLDGSEHKYEAPKASLPKEFSYVNVLPSVLDQGDEPICVPCSIDCYFKWNKEVNKINQSIDLNDIFIRAGGTKEGMSFKDAFSYLRKTNKLNYYAMIGSETSLKHAIILNGPCMAALPVYNSSSIEFWNGYKLEGGHAIAIVGYDEEGFIIRNSWGSYYGHDGYSNISYKDFNKFLEIWTII